MWTLRVYNPNDDELVAEHGLAGDQALLESVLGIALTPYGSTPLDKEALRHLDMAFHQLGQPGRESWQGRECFLDYDAEPTRAPLRRKAGRQAAEAGRR
jgi:hypothetical protein